MKKIKLLPSIIMLALCLAVLGIGVYSATTGSNTISGTLTVNSAGYEVEISVYKGTDSAHGSLIAPNMYGTQIGVTTTSRAGADITLSNLEFNSGEANIITDVDMIDVIVAVTNKSNTDLGIYFWNKGNAVQAPTQATINNSFNYNNETYRYDLTVNSTDVLYGHQQLDGVDSEAGLVAYNDIVDAEYSFYHHLPGYYTLTGESGDNDYAYGKYTDSNGKRYYTEYLHVYLRLNEFTSEDVDVDLDMFVNVEEYEANLTSSDLDEYNCAIYYDSNSFVKVAKNITELYFGDDGNGANQNIAQVVLPYGFTCLDGQAYDEYNPYTREVFGESSVSAVSIPSTVTSLGLCAVRNCDNLTSLIIPHSVTSLDGSGFESAGLKSVFIPSGVSVISNYNFGNGLDLISVSADNTTYDSRDNCNAIIETSSNTLLLGTNNTIIPNSVTSIGFSAFCNCNELRSVNANNVNEIGNFAFQYCSSLTDVNIPLVTSIGNKVFEDCSALETVNMSNSLSSIGSQAFYNCHSLLSLNLPATLETIGSSAFTGCSGLESISVAAGNSVYDSRDNCDALILTASNKIILGCKNSTVPSSVRVIGASAFHSCTELTSIDLSNITTIEASAFYGCTGLTTLNIPNGVTSIGASAFKGCTGLTSVAFNATLSTALNSNSNVFSAAGDAVSGLAVTFGGNISTIPAYLFYGATNLTSVTIPNNINTIGNGAFGYCTRLSTIFIPSSVTVMSGSGYFNSPFLFCSSSLVVNCQAASKPAGWGAYWNYYSSSGTLTTNWSQTR